MVDFLRQHIPETIYAGVVTTLAVAVKKLFDRMKKEFDEQARIKNGVLAILRDRLYQSCQFYINQGYLTVGDMENIDGLYNSYHELGGNGIGTELFERTKQLEIKK